MTTDELIDLLSGMKACTQHDHDWGRNDEALYVEIERRVRAPDSAPEVGHMAVNDGHSCEHGLNRELVECGQCAAETADVGMSRCGNCDEALFPMIGECPVCGKDWPIEPL